MSPTIESLSSNLRNKVGLLVLGLLSALIVIVFFSIRKHGRLGQVNSARPSMNPPKLVSLVQYPVRLTVGQQQGSFHGSQSCLIASINGMNYDKPVALESGAVIGLGGWLIDKMIKAVPKRAWVILAGQGAANSYQVPITLHEKRPDVSQSFGNIAGYTNSGFIVDISSTDLPADTYHVYIVFDHDDEYYTCDNGRQLKLG